MGKKARVRKGLATKTQDSKTYFKGSSGRPGRKNGILLELTLKKFMAMKAHHKMSKSHVQLAANPPMHAVWSILS